MGLVGGRRPQLHRYETHCCRRFKIRLSVLDQGDSLRRRSHCPEHPVVAFAVGLGPPVRNADVEERLDLLSDPKSLKDASRVAGGSVGEDTEPLGQEAEHRHELRLRFDVILHYQALDRSLEELSLRNSELDLKPPRGGAVLMPRTHADAVGCVVSEPEAVGDELRDGAIARLEQAGIGMVQSVVEVEEDDLHVDGRAVGFTARACCDRSAPPTDADGRLPGARIAPVWLRNRRGGCPIAPAPSVESVEIDAALLDSEVAHRGVEMMLPLRDSEHVQGGVEILFSGVELLGSVRPAGRAEHLSRLRSRRRI